MSVTNNPKLPQIQHSAVYISGLPDSQNAGMASGPASSGVSQDSFSQNQAAQGLGVGSVRKMGTFTAAHMAKAATFPLPFSLPGKLDKLKMETELSKLSKTAVSLMQLNDDLRDHYLLTIWYARHFELPSDGRSLSPSDPMGVVAYELENRVGRMCDVIKGNASDEKLLAMAAAAMLPVKSFAIGDWKIIDKLYESVAAQSIPKDEAARIYDKFHLERYYLSAISLAKLAEQFYGRTPFVVRAVSALFETISSLRRVPGFPSKRMADLISMYASIAVREKDGVVAFQVNPLRPEIVNGINILKEISGYSTHDVELIVAIRKFLGYFANLSTINSRFVVEES